MVRINIGGSMKNIIYDHGQKINESIFLRDVCVKNGRRKAAFICFYCGNEFTANIDDVKHGNTKSCGCYKKLFPSHKKHDLKGTWAYERWKAIKQRCYNENYKEFHYYGGRGIKMSDEWKNNPQKFCDYVESLPNYDKNNVGRGKLTIDRIENEGNYEPGNVRLANDHVQNANQRMSSKNRYGYKGINLRKNGRYYRSRIRVNKKLISLGDYMWPDDAYKARVTYILDHNLTEYL